MMMMVVMGTRQGRRQKVALCSSRRGTRSLKSGRGLDQIEGGWKTSSHVE